MQAAILAGGLGTRLRPLTYEVPKPMVPINNKPYLEYQLEYLKKQGITEIVLLIGYLGEQIINYFGDGQPFGMNIRYSVEDKPMGTGGGLKKAKGVLEEDFLLIYGDSFLPIDYNDLIKKYKKYQAKAVICAYDNRVDTDVISNVEIDETTCRVLRYVKNVNDAALRYVDAGVLLLNKKVLECIPENEVVSLEQQIFPRLIAQQSLYAYVSKERFYDIGTPDRLALAMEVLR